MKVLVGWSDDVRYVRAVSDYLRLGRFGVRRCRRLVPYVVVVDGVEVEPITGFLTSLALSDASP